MKTITHIADEYAKFAKWVAVISGIIVVCLMLYTTVDVAGRYLANNPMPAAYEFTNMFLIYITYFGITLVQARGGHMRLGFLWEKARPRGRALIDLFSVIIGLFIVSLITWQGWLYAIYSWQVSEVTMGLYTIPLFPGRIALAIGSAIFLIQYIIDAIRNILVVINPEAAPTFSPPTLTGAEAEAAKPNPEEAGTQL
jgi:TRAP-type C4-dicarboxylate transport system permease small subunit